MKLKKELRLLILFILATAIKSYCLTFSIDSFTYEVIDDEAKSVSVSMSNDDFKQDILHIPATVEYEGITYTITKIWKFNLYSKILELYLPNTVTEIGDEAFARHKYLTTVHLPESLEVIGNNAFYLTNVQSIEIPSSIRRIGFRSFCRCRSLNTVTIADADQPYVIEAMAFDRAAITSLSLGENLTSIGDYAFNDGAKMESLKFPSTLKSIGDNAFVDCNKLKNLEFNEELTYIGKNNFCKTALRTITFTSKIHQIDNSFSDNPILTEINFPEDSLVIRGGFNNLKSLKSLKINKSVKDINYSTFYNCVNIEEISVDDGNDIYDSRDNCNAIIKSKYNTLIKGCKNTVIPEGVDSISTYAFSELTFKTVRIPNSVKYIDAAYNNCSIDTLYIGNSVLQIRGAWAGVKNLKAIYISAKRPPIQSLGVFDSDIYSSCTLYVPRGYASVYYANTDWNKFLNIEEWDPESEEDIHTYKVFGDLNGDDDVNVGDISKLYEIILSKE